MVLIKCKELEPGMILARDAVNYNGLVLLPAGTVLDDPAITRLLFHEIAAVYIEEQRENDAQIRMTCSYGERIRVSPEFAEFKKNYEEEVGCFKQTINGLVEKNLPLDIEELTDQVYGLLQMNKGNIPVFDLLHNMRQYDDATYSHSMNVAIISNMLAYWLKWPEEKVQLATVCGLLHDIGKLRIPQKLIQKPGKLSEEEYEIVKSHSLEGYRFLKSRGARPEIQLTALMHHEKCDGSGYPLHLKRNEINSYAKLVTIADIYDAMTSARIYRGPLCPFKVVQIFEEEGLQKYDTEYILTFLDNVTNTYLQNRVRLSNGREGEIIMIQKECLSRPLVKCGTEIVDLKEHPELEITEIL